MATSQQQGTTTTPSSPSSSSSSSSLLRLSGLQTSQIPSPAAPADQLRPFLASLLQEAIPLLNSACPPPPTTTPDKTKPLWRPKGTRTFPESAAPVHLTERTIGGATWACRRSVHADAARRGTASWAEFARWLRDEHAAAEEAFTPTVLAHRVGARWGADAAGLDLGPVEVVATAAAAAEGSGLSSASSWRGFRVAVVEMLHRVPAPLRRRVFPVLQVICSSCAAAGPGGSGGSDDDDNDDEFLVISVPVADWGSGAAAEGWRGLAGLSAEKGVVVGAYVSVERVRRLGRAARGEGGDGKVELGGEEGQIEWVMATASDAKGVLPMWVQTRAVPGAIAKDVALFLGWVDGERGKRSGGGGGE